MAHKRNKHLSTEKECIRLHKHSILVMAIYFRKIFAFDKDQKRLVTLQNMMKKFGATSVIAKCQDFLSVNPNDNTYRNVEYILVDPSCSGTGKIVVRASLG